MGNITGLSAFASPNIDVQRDGESRSYQQALLQENVSKLRSSQDGADQQLAPLLESALGLSRDRGILINTVLGQNTDPHSKAQAVEDMAGLRLRASNVIRAALVNRLVSYGVIDRVSLDDYEAQSEKLDEILELVDVTATQGYYHDIQTGRDYADKPLSPGESLRY